MKRNLLITCIPFVQNWNESIQTCTNHVSGLIFFTISYIDRSVTEEKNSRKKGQQRFHIEWRLESLAPKTRLTKLQTKFFPSNSNIVENFTMRVTRDRYTTEKRRRTDSE